MSRPAHYNVPPRAHLTARQREVMAPMAKGRTNGQIAEALGITIDGAKFHVSEILARFGVSSREEAVAAWRAGRRPAVRLAGLGALLIGHKVLTGVVAAAATVAIVAGGVAGWMALRASDSTAQVTVDDVIAALQQPGKVAVTEGEIRPADSDPLRVRSWYSADERSGKIETIEDGAVTDIQLVTADVSVSYNSRHNSYHERPVGTPKANAPDVAIETVIHISMLLRADEVRFAGPATFNGERVWQFEATEVVEQHEAYEQVVGTTHTMVLFIRQADLLAVGTETRSVVPGEGTSSPVEFLITRSELVDRASLPADFFDPAGLSDAHVTQAEALALAGRQDFATFWLGSRLVRQWSGPGGPPTAEHVLSGVRVPGVAGVDPGFVTLSYAPSTLTTLALVHVSQSASSPGDPVSAEQLAAMEAGGNVEHLQGGSGYVYVQYSPGMKCDSAQAQLPDAAATEGCRFGHAGQWGAVIERDGTVVHITAGPFYDTDDPSSATDTNPFNSREAMLDLVDLLQPIP